MDRGDADAQARDPNFEFEVKEQDRWLPIANGWFSMHCQLPISFAGRRTYDMLGAGPLTAHCVSRA
jgi:hypothetical protein